MDSGAKFLFVFAIKTRTIFYRSVSKIKITFSSWLENENRLTRDVNTAIRWRKKERSFVVRNFRYLPGGKIIESTRYTCTYTRLINHQPSLLSLSQSDSISLFAFSPPRSRYWPRRDSEKPRGKILILGILFSVGTTPKGYNTNNFEENFS